MSMRTRAGKKISLTNYEELLAVPTIEGASDIPLDQLHEFKGHPFHVVDDEAMDELVESIKAKGVLSPAIARKRPEGGFELISGHRRTHAARRAGLDKIPVFVKDYSDDEAVCIMVDSNIQRERILPSEKAFEVKGDNKIDDEVVLAKKAAAEEMAVASGVRYLMYAGSTLMKNNVLETAEYENASIFEDKNTSTIHSE